MFAARLPSAWAKSIARCRYRSRQYLEWLYRQTSDTIVTTSHRDADVLYVVVMNRKANIVFVQAHLPAAVTWALATERLQIGRLPCPRAGSDISPWNTNSPLTLANQSPSIQHEALRIHPRRGSY